MASIRGAGGPYRFEGDYGATSSLTAVMGRMATYSEKLVTWHDAIRSELHLAPDRYALDVRPPAVRYAPGELSHGHSRHDPGLVMSASQRTGNISKATPAARRLTRSPNM